MGFQGGGGGGPVEGVKVRSTGISSGLVLTAQGDGTSLWGSVAGTGDVVGPAASVASELVLFDGTTGKLIKRGSGSGYVKATSGVVSYVAAIPGADVVAATGSVAGAVTTAAQTFAGTKTLLGDGSANAIAVRFKAGTVTGTSRIYWDNSDATRGFEIDADFTAAAEELLFQSDSTTIMGFSRSGQWFAHYNGTKTTPFLSAFAEQDTGLYRNGNKDWRFSVHDTDMIKFTDTEVAVLTGHFRIVSGDVYRPDNAGLGFQFGNGANIALGSFECRNAASTNTRFNVTDLGVVSIPGLTASKLVMTDGSSNLTTGTPSIAQGGTGQVTKAAAFDALSPMTTSGDIIYGGASGTGTRLAKGSDGQVLTLASGIPSWAAAAGGVTYGTDVHWVSNFNGHGSTATKIGKWTTVTQAVTTNGDITYASSSTNGDSWTINHAGIYALYLNMSSSTSVLQVGVSVNAPSLTTNITSTAITNQVMLQETGTTWELAIGAVWVFAANDVIRVHTNGDAGLRTGETNGREQFWIRRLA